MNSIQGWPHELSFTVFHQRLACRSTILVHRKNVEWQLLDIRSINWTNRYTCTSSLFSCYFNSTSMTLYNRSRIRNTMIDRNAAQCWSSYRSHARSKRLMLVDQWRESGFSKMGCLLVFVVCSILRIQGLTPRNQYLTDQMQCANYLYLCNGHCKEL